MTPAAAVEAMLARHGMPPVGARPYDLCVLAVRNATDSNLFDDVEAVAYRTTLNGPIVVEIWRCTTEPGWKALERPMRRSGTFRLRADYRHKGLWKPGYHKQDDYGRTRPALVQATTGAVGERDGDGDRLFDAPVPVTDGGGINNHDGYNEDRPDQPVDIHSYGCVVAAKKRILRLRELVALQASHGMGHVVSLHLFNRSTNPEAAVLFAAVGLS